VILQPDLLGIFHSGTHELDGYALIAGTGSVAARIRDGELARVVGGRGWLLGDAGSGFWIGHRVARAVIAALDDQVAPTALTELVLTAVGIELPVSSLDQLRALDELLTVLYARRPVELSAFAPLAFQAHADPAARQIVLAASTALAQLIGAVRVPDGPGPVIVGGSVAVRGMLAAPLDLRSELTEAAAGATLTPVSDGVVGAAVLALRSAEITVDATVFRTLRAEVSRIAAGAG
jgi:glucosamine kinase